ncbi:hypothetical protein IAR50_004907 [Cryptococcus sp. DSM 104548]
MPVMGKYLGDLRLAVEQGVVGLDESWAPGTKPRRIRFTNIAPHPPNIDIPKILIKAFAGDNGELNERSKTIFRKWYSESVSYEETSACECCSAFREQDAEEALPLDSKQNKTKKRNKSKSNKKKEQVQVESLDHCSMFLQQEAEATVTSAREQTEEKSDEEAKQLKEQQEENSKWMMKRVNASTTVGQETSLSTTSM